MNQIIVNFIECDPAPSKGYNIKWRVFGSGDPYTDAGNFFTSPAVFNDNTNPDGTQYEGKITAQGRNTDCNPVDWNTFIEESGGSSSGGGFDNSSCGTQIGETTTSNLFVPLPMYDLNVDGASQVDLNYNVYPDRPNRFTVYDNGAFMITSGWRGFAPYAGPWGMSLNTVLSGTLTFNPLPGHNYQLFVEVGPAGPAPYNVNDTFTVDIICS